MVSSCPQSRPPVSSAQPPAAFRNSVAPMPRVPERLGHAPRERTQARQEARPRGGGGRDIVLRFATRHLSRLFVGFKCIFHVYKNHRSGVEPQYVKDSCLPLFHCHAALHPTPVPTWKAIGPGSLTVRSSTPRPDPGAGWIWGLAVWCGGVRV